MFILKRQDVEISNIQHPKRDSVVPILSYQGQTFRLISVFKASQEEEAKALWRDLTDNRGKACVLLEEPERYSVWGKIRLEQLESDTGNQSKMGIFTLACIMLLQAVYMDIEDFLGTRQAGLFEKSIMEVLQRYQFPQTNSPNAVKHLLTMDSLQLAPMLNWQEQHVTAMLQELHRLGKSYFGNTNFVQQAIDRLQDMPEPERSLFMTWLNQSSLSKLWH
ncbi:Npun_F0813 family protein [Iningainema tapete]|uniref:Uncharacterized protein n=1 Tax=Iningainema tapete BLCC-T55 TaxID=2748662 RepID=A0A8J6XY22_9CYAN|nr:Npun_F0813 family protein [Iningainema tapete]MBD2775108.1 hypothetical protein [Iningainema tapete BLCC-T55]